MSLAFETIPHLSTSSLSAGDAVLNEDEERGFLRARVQVFEKLDGINAVLHHGRRGIEVHLKPAWERALGGRVYRGVEIWAALKGDELRAAIPPRGAIVVEWLRYTLDIQYAGLPDFAVAIAARDPDGSSLTSREAAAWFRRAGLATNPPLFSGRLGSVAALRRLVRRSRFARARMEGVVVEKLRPDDVPWCKWVRPGYAQPSPDALARGRVNRLAEGA